MNGAVAVWGGRVAVGERGALWCARPARVDCDFIVLVRVERRSAGLFGCIEDGLVAQYSAPNRSC